MSKLTYRTPVAGTAVFTLEPPATNTDRTLTLPDADGELLMKDSATMPTVNGDPIVESGSNSDGEWTRWADGTQVVRVRISGPDLSVNTWTYPSVFTSDVSGISLAAERSSVGDFVRTMIRTVYADSLTFQSDSFESIHSVQISTFGRWK